MSKLDHGVSTSRTVWSARPLRAANVREAAAEGGAAAVARPCRLSVAADGQTLVLEPSGAGAPREEALRLIDHFLTCSL